ncbi:hydrolase [Pasteurella multocida]|nr:HAD hydrolase-like protein [Pasteurella multocida]MCL7825779.1 hydrolase [Pasteurella multocida]URI03973.1 hydrolase [Pasteurella multocida]HDR1185563.1 hydrolase [Pasteurella multocida]HDR1314429.1 hydrolase [Pasteurella multocida]HDR1891346.1 hydrolase [Pasteurella multocida]
MKISSVIFDMDGVMIDSEPLWAKAQIHALANVDIQITIQTCEQLTGGKRIDEMASI